MYKQDNFLYQCQFCNDSNPNTLKNFFRSTTNGCYSYVVNKTNNIHEVTRIQTNYKYETNSLDIRNKFNENFSTIVQKLVEKIDSRLNLQNFINRSNDETFLLSPTDTNKIEKIIRSLDSRKPNDIYGSTVDMLKFLAF